MYLYYRNFNLLFIILVVPVVLMISSCQFRPVYSNYSNSQESNQSSLKQDLSQIEISTIPERHGQILRNYLLDLLPSYSSSKSSLTDLQKNNPLLTINEFQSKYKLVINLSTNMTFSGLQINNTTSFATLYCTVTYSLFDNAKNISLYTNRLSTQFLFVLPNDGFAELSAKNDAIDHSMNELAKQLLIQLQLFFIQKNSPNKDEIKS